MKRMENLQYINVGMLSREKDTDIRLALSSNFCSLLLNANVGRDVWDLSFPCCVHVVLTLNADDKTTYFSQSIAIVCKSNSHCMMAKIKCILLFCVLYPFKSQLYKKAI